MLGAGGQERGLKEVRYRRGKEGVVYKAERRDSRFGRFGRFRP